MVLLTTDATSLVVLTSPLSWLIWIGGVLAALILLGLLVRWLVSLRTRPESFATQLKLLASYLRPRNLVTSVRLLFRNDTAFWYTKLGDEVLEWLDDDFKDDNKVLWLNLGYWREARTYPEAAQALARRLADAAGLSERDEVLDVGFGYGVQDILWQEAYRPKKITGLNITPLHVEVGNRLVQEKGLADRIDLRLGSATKLDFPAASFDRVMALECAFHFDTREAFFDEAVRVLRPGGRLALADMLPMPGDSRASYISSWFMRRRSGWPLENMYDREVYRQKLEQHGFVDISVESIRGLVYPGMYKYILARYAGQKMEEIVVELTAAEIEECRGVELWEGSMNVGDYVIVTAAKPD